VTTQWSGLCHSCGVFNQQDWITPTIEGHGNGKQITRQFDGDLISPPQIAMGR
jgi:hypothetical protein